MRKNGFGIVILVVIVGVIAFAVFLFSNEGQKQTTTSNLTNSAEQSIPTPGSSNVKVYVNKKYGYSFEYPLNFEIKESGVAVHGYSKEDNFEFIYYGDSGATLSSQDKNLLDSGPKITVDGHVGYVTQCDTGCEEGGQEPSVQIDIYDTLRFQFIFHGVKELSNTDRQILSSFKFGNAS